ncbi:MAG TPA: glycosyltransferase [Candidatus Woesebacteria bacterium]|nr:glycosyltransferase [Candidatus Woesebacteria bacterium]
MSNTFTISLIIPCYNEVANIQKGVLDKIGNYTKNDNRFKEVLIVDDGSKDESRKIIKDKYLSLFPKFKLIENKHLGKAFAIIKGIEKASGEYVMFCDIDLATPIEEAEKLITQVKKNYDVVIGSRSSDRAGAPLTRKIMAFGMIFIRHYIIGLKGIKDTQCGFKMFNKKAADDIISHLQVFRKKAETEGSSVSAGFDLEFLFLASKLGYSIKEIPVIWRHVETKNVTFLKSSIEGLKDIIYIKWYDILKKYPH